MKLSHIYIEDQTSLNSANSWVDLKNGLSSKEIADAFNERINLIKNPSSVKGIVISGITLVKGSNVNKAQFSLMSQRLMEVFKNNPQFDSFSLDTKKLYIDDASDIQNTVWVDLKFDLSVSEIESLLNQRYVPQN